VITVATFRSCGAGPGRASRRAERAVTAMKLEGLVRSAGDGVPEVAGGRGPRISSVQLPAGGPARIAWAGR
jgi:hypothetical protein